MKKLLALLLPALMTAVVSPGQKKLSAFFSYATFNQPSKSPFIETYLSVDGLSVKFSKNDRNKFQSIIQIQWVLKQDEKIVFFDKYNLLSPEMETADDSKPDFLDQFRISAPNGSYILELNIADKNSLNSNFIHTEKVMVSYPVDKISISDIELLESFTKAENPGKLTKSGYDLLPYINNFYPEEQSSIKFYAELYNARSQLGDESFLVRYSIVNDNNKQTAGDLVGLKKMKAEDVNILMAELPLDKLGSGNYTLNVEARDKENKLLAFKSVFFQRSNTIQRKIVDLSDDFSVFDVNNTFVANITDGDTLKDYIASLYPISGPRDRQVADNQIALANVQSMQQYFYYFWIRQDKADPAKRWNEYKAEVDKVNANYGINNKRGYDSERGRVYLQYGPPNSIEISTIEPDTYPYEIWHYYLLGRQTNRKFVFYTRDGSSNNYVLLHSDATGEPSAYDWQLQLHKRSKQYGVDMDQETAPKVYGDKALENFKHPK